MFIIRADMKKDAILQSWLVEIISDCGKMLAKSRRFLCAEMNFPQVSQFGSALEAFPQSFMYNKYVLLHSSWLY